jgi:hypothetical protein
MEDYQLPEPQKRSLGVALRVIEKSFDEMSIYLGGTRDRATYSIHNDLDGEEITRILSILGEIDESIKKLCKKYNLGREMLSLAHLLEVRKIYLLTILEDVKSRKMKRYGDFSEAIKDDYDNDITCIIQLIERL